MMSENITKAGIDDEGYYCINCLRSDYHWGTPLRNEMDRLVKEGTKKIMIGVGPESEDEEVYLYHMPNYSNDFYKNPNFVYHRTGGLSAFVEKGRYYSADEGIVRYKKKERYSIFGDKHRSNGPAMIIKEDAARGIYTKYEKYFLFGDEYNASKYWNDSKIKKIRRYSTDDEYNYESYMNCKEIARNYMRFHKLDGPYWVKDNVNYPDVGREVYRVAKHEIPSSLYWSESFSEFRKVALSIDDFVVEYKMCEEYIGKLKARMHLISA